MSTLESSDIASVLCYHAHRIRGKTMLRSLTVEQSRAARGLLNWSQNQLADAANIGRATIRRFEAGRRTPIPNNLAAIRRALEDAGVEFISAKGGKGVGVRLIEDQEQ
jgi:transcriptional regulator with XRE-family HTH domain